MYSAPWYRPVAVAADLSPDVVTGWIANTTRAHDLVPDACVDVVWLDNGELWVCGPETTGWTFSIPGGTEAVGLRFRPGRAGGVLGFNAAELRDCRVALHDVLGARAGRQLADELGAAHDSAERVGIVQRRARTWLASASEPDRHADSVLRQLRRDMTTPVRTLAAATGLSERQLERRCDAAFGYGPATLRRILRLQRVMRLARHPAAPRSLARLAVQAGYTDQQHLARDCRSIARTTPTVLVGRRHRARPSRDDVGSVQDLAG